MLFADNRDIGKIKNGLPVAFKASGFFISLKNKGRVGRAFGQKEKSE
jgi:hypothetical protein